MKALVFPLFLCAPLCCGSATAAIALGNDLADPHRWSFEYPQHQLTVFIMHQSGGLIFDRGGVNDIGLGYRYGF